MSRISLLLSLLLLAACSGDPQATSATATESEPAAAAEAPAPAEPDDAPPAPTTANAALCDGDWQLVSLKNGGEAVALDAQHLPTLSCMPDNKMGGNATINRYFGTADIGSDGSVKWAGPGFGSTMMAGPEHLMKQEVAYLGALHSADRYRLEGGQLVFSNGSGKTELVYKTAP